MMKYMTDINITLYIKYRNSEDVAAEMNKTYSQKIRWEKSESKLAVDGNDRT